MYSAVQESTLAAMGITRWLLRTPSSMSTGLRLVHPLSPQTQVIVLLGSLDNWESLDLPTRQCLAGIVQATGLGASIVPAFLDAKGGTWPPDLTYLCFGDDHCKNLPPGAKSVVLPAPLALIQTVTARQECYMLLKNAHMLQEFPC